MVVVFCLMDAGYGLEMITTIGYVAGSDNQASLNVNSAAGFLGAVARARAGRAAWKLFSLKAFRAARLKTPAAARLMLSARSSAGSEQARGLWRCDGRAGAVRSRAQPQFQLLKPLSSRAAC